MTNVIKKVGWLLTVALISGCASQMSNNSGAPVEDSDTSVRVPGMEAPERDGSGQTGHEQDESGTQQNNSGWRVIEPVEDPEPQMQGSRNSAVDSLLSQGRTQYQSGDYKRAIASAERALRIDRRNPAVYLLLAENYQRLDNNDQAQQFAQQGLRYSRSDHTVDAALRGLLEEL